MGDKNKDTSGLTVRRKEDQGTLKNVQDETGKEKSRSIMPPQSEDKADVKALQEFSTLVKENEKHKLIKAVYHWAKTTDATTRKAVLASGSSQKKELEKRLNDAPLFTIALKCIYDYDSYVPPVVRAEEEAATEGGPSDKKIEQQAKKNLETIDLEQEAALIETKKDMSWRENDLLDFLSLYTKKKAKVEHLPQIIELLVGLRGSALLKEKSAEIKGLFQQDTWADYFVEHFLAGGSNTLAYVGLASGLVTEQKEGKADKKEIQYLLRKESAGLFKSFGALSNGKLKDALEKRIEKIDKTNLYELFKVEKARFLDNSGTADLEAATSKDVSDAELGHLNKLMKPFLEASFSLDSSALLEAVTEWMQHASDKALEKAAQDKSDYMNNVAKLKGAKLASIDERSATFLRTAMESISLGKQAKAPSVVAPEKTTQEEESTTDETKITVAISALKSTKKDVGTSILGTAIDIEYIEKMIAKLSPSECAIVHKATLEHANLEKDFDLDKERLFALNQRLETKNQASPALNTVLKELVDFRKKPKNLLKDKNAEKFSNLCLSMTKGDWQLFKNLSFVQAHKAEFQPALAGTGMFGAKDTVSLDSVNEESVAAAQNNTLYWADLLKKDIKAKKESVLAQTLYRIQAVGQQKEKAEGDVFVHAIKSRLSSKEVKYLVGELTYNGTNLYAKFEQGELSAADLTKFARRGLSGHEDEVKTAGNLASSKDLLKMSNYEKFKALVATKMNEQEEDSKDLFKSAELNSFVIDFNASYIKDIYGEMGAKSRASVEFLSQMRQKLAKAVEEDMQNSFEGLGWQSTLVASRIKSVALVNEEAVSKRGVQWSSFSVTSIERKSRFAEAKGQAQVLNDTVSTKDKTVDEANVEAHLKDTAEKEKAYLRVNENFKTVKAKFDALLKKAIGVAIGGILSIVSGALTGGMAPVLVALLSGIISEAGTMVTDIIGNAVAGEPLLGTNKAMMAKALKSAFTIATSVASTFASQAVSAGTFGLGIDEQKGITDFFEESVAKLAPEQYAGMLVGKAAEITETLDFDKIIQGASKSAITKVTDLLGSQLDKALKTNPEEGVTESVDAEKEKEAPTKEVEPPKNTADLLDKIEDAEKEDPKPITADKDKDKDKDGEQASEKDETTPSKEKEQEEVEEQEEAAQKEDSTKLDLKKGDMQMRIQNMLLLTDKNITKYHKNNFCTVSAVLQENFPLSKYKGKTKAYPKYKSTLDLMLKKIEQTEDMEALDSIDKDLVNLEANIDTFVKEETKAIQFYKKHLRFAIKEVEARQADLGDRMSAKACVDKKRRIVNALTDINGLPDNFTQLVKYTKQIKEHVTSRRLDFHIKEVIRKKKAKPMNA